jgi:hypothetical protein
LGKGRFTSITRPRLGDEAVTLFERMPHRPHDGIALMWAFDLIELKLSSVQGLPRSRAILRAWSSLGFLLRAKLLDKVGD